jgi:hypothetical protein
MNKINPNHIESLDLLGIFLKTIVNDEQTS